MRARIPIRPKDADLPVSAAKRLEALEYRLAVMEGEAGGMYRDRGARHDLRLPPLAVGMTKAEHVVGEVIAEPEAVVVDFAAAARRDPLDVKIVESERHAGLRRRGDP